MPTMKADSRPCSVHRCMVLECSQAALGGGQCLKTTRGACWLMKWSQSSCSTQQPHEGQGLAMKLVRVNTLTEMDIAYGEGDGKFLPLNGALA